MAGKNLMHRVAFCAFALLIVFWAWSDSLFHLASLIWFVDSYSHGLLVPLISAGLIWSRRGQIDGAMISTDWLGLPVLAVASLGWYLGTVAEVKIVEHVALILAVQGVIITVMGREVYRLYLFAFLFLFLMVPVGASLIPVMQTITAEIVIFMLGVAGVPFESEGVLISLSSGMYEVARACAGIKFFFTSVVTGVLLAHLAYRSWKGRLAILIVAAILPVAANAVRVLGILLIAEATDASFAKGIDHVVYGWGFLSVILFLLIAVAYKFSDRTDSEAEQTAPPLQQQANNPGVSLTSGYYTLGAAAFPLLAYFIAPVDALAPKPVAAIEAPACENCDFRLLDKRQEIHASAWRNADSKFEFSYRYAADTLTVSGALYCPQRQGSKLVQVGNLPGGMGWDLLPGTERKTIKVGNWILEQRVYWKNDQRRTVFIGYFLNGKSVISENMVKLETAVERVTKGVSAGAAYVFSIPEHIDSSRNEDKIKKFLSTFPLDTFLWSGLKTSDKGRNLCVA